jgi:hypothetical protein
MLLNLGPSSKNFGPLKEKYGKLRKELQLQEFKEIEFGSKLIIYK